MYQRGHVALSVNVSMPLTCVLIIHLPGLSNISTVPNCTAQNNGTTVRLASTCKSCTCKVHKILIIPIYAIINSSFFSPLLPHTSTPSQMSGNVPTQFSVHKTLAAPTVRLCMSVANVVQFASKLYYQRCHAILVSINDTCIYKFVWFFTIFMLLFFFVVFNLLSSHNYIKNLYNYFCLCFSSVSNTITLK